MMMNGDESTVYIVADTLVNLLQTPIYDMCALPELPDLSEGALRAIMIQGPAPVPESSEEGEDGQGEDGGEGGEPAEEPERPGVAGTGSLTVIKEVQGGAGAAAAAWPVRTRWARWWS